MTIAQILIILVSFTLTSWFIAWMMIEILFRPVKPIKIAGFKLQGIIPAKHEYLSARIGSLVQSAFQEYKGLDELVADPALLEKLKPQIEDHVDHFLKEKLKTVFPLLSQFMGEKTLNQFKTAFLVEIDNLFPALMKNYITDLKKQVKLDAIIAEKINAVSITALRKSFYLNATKETRYFKLVCAAVGLISGAITVLILATVNI